MSKEDLSNFYTGNSRKHVFESGGKDEASIFLEGLDLSFIVSLQSANSNGSSKWVGERIDHGLNALDKKSIVDAKGSGCLEIIDGDSRTTIFMKQGEVVKECREVVQRKLLQGADPRQSKMLI